MRGGAKLSEGEKIEEVGSPPKAARRKRWAQLIQQVFEIDPLICAACGGQMKILALIRSAQQPVLDRILDPFGQADVEPRCTGPPAWVTAWQTEPVAEEVEWELIDPVYEEPAWTATP